MRRYLLALLALLLSATGGNAADKPDCSRPLTLALHHHGLLYSSISGQGIDKDFSDELIRRSGCKISVTVLPRARIWQLIEAGALDFSLSGISNEERDKFAAFSWYFSNKYYLLVRKDANVRQLADFESAPALQLGAIRGFRYSRNANRLLDRLHADRRVSYASSLDPLYQVLALNRIQGMIIEPFDYADLDGNHIRQLADIIEINDEAIRHGLIMSRKSIPPAQQEKWRALVDAMRADGTVLRIFEKYLKPELAKAMVEFRD
jgi:polar amino acid transport system substrate-binding protein